METTKNGNGDPGEKSVYPLMFAVLVPHRGFLPEIETYRRNLFAAGIEGSFSFPAVSPLALLKRPLETEELKKSAAELRRLLRNKKIASIKQAEYNAWFDPPLRFRFFGMELELPLPAFPPETVLYYCKHPILAPALLAPGDNPGQSILDAGSQVFSFSAAALANLTLKPVLNEKSADNTGVTAISCFERNYSFSWELGHLFWLPKKLLY